MKTITSVLAIAFAVSFAFDCEAQRPNRQQGQRGENAGEGGRRRPPQGMPEPAQMAARMMREFDKDGDKKLDTAELTALLTALRDRRASQARPGWPASYGR